MAKAAGEMSHWPEYDYVVVNREKAARLRGGARHPRCRRVRRERQIGLSDFVRSLQAQL
jgi:guanylate kinase